MELIVAAVCGFLSGLGVGGGSLLMVWLTAAAGIPQEAARSINLLYFLPTAAAAVLLHGKHRCIEGRGIGMAILGGAAGAAAGILLSGYLPAELLRKLFGAFLLWVGVLEWRKAE